MIFKFSKHEFTKFILLPPSLYILQFTYIAMASKHFLRWGWTACGLCQLVCLWQYLKQLIIGEEEETREMEPLALQDIFWIYSNNESLQVNLKIHVHIDYHFSLPILHLHIQVPYTPYISQGLNFAFFAFYKNYTQKTKIYMVHNLFLTDSWNFNPTKYMAYTIWHTV